MAAGEGEFKSFRDLLRSRGSEDRNGEEEPGEGSGGPAEGEIRLERAGGEPGGERLGTAGHTPAGSEQDTASAGEDEGSRERILGRPPGWGPMETGPPVYRSTESEEMEILGSFRVRTVFPPDVLAEIAALPTDPGPADREGRVDLRGAPLFTIDGEDAKDFDDAIAMRALEDGGVELGVHIADVGHYVRPGTALDAEALARATSVYLPDQVVPMLPEALSNHLCSLVPGRDRLAYSVVMDFGPDGKRRAARVHKSVIRSARRCTYREVQELLDGQGTPPADLAALEPSLRLLEAWTRRQQQLRDAKGSLRMQSREQKFVFDEQHEVAGVVDAPRYFSMALIEETALAANQAVGDLFRSKGLPTLYRVHPEKDPEEIEAVAKLLEDHGLRVPRKERLTGRDIGRLIQTARKRANAEALIQRIMGLVERAVYEVRDHTDVAKHFGLAREAYLHFTSPIRRYPDLLVHRWLWAVESRGDAAHAELRAEDLVADLNDVAMHCSLQAEVADMAARAVGDLKVCQYMEPHIGEKLMARVLRVSRAGLEVRLDGFNVLGFLPARAIGERSEVKGPTLLVRKGRQALSFTEGHPVAVRVEDVDFLRLQVQLELG